MSPENYCESYEKTARKRLNQRLPKYLLQCGTWIAVCDSGKALLLENKGSREYPKLEPHRAFEQKNPPTHAQGSAPPGRSFNSASGNRSSTEEADFHELAERRFLHDFAKCIDRCVHDHGVRSLILVAPARALGMIRPELSEAVKHALVAEICKDYVKKPLYEIEQLLQS